MAQIKKAFPDSAVKLDRFELRYVDTPDGPMYVSHCHNAAVSVDYGGVMYCKACYGEVDPMLGAIPEPGPSVSGSAVRRRPVRQASSGRRVVGRRA